MQVLSSDRMCNHYTSFPSISRMQAVCDFLYAGVTGENVILYQNQGNRETVVCRPRSLSSFNCYVLTLMRFRRKYDIAHIPFLFNINGTTASTTFITWINFMCIKLGEAYRYALQCSMSPSVCQSLRIKFPHIKVIIDSVEFRVESASSLFLHKVFLFRL